MNFTTVVIIAFGLAMDAFAVSIVSSAALGKATPRQIFRLSFHFGLFQAGMPILGWLAGTSVASWIADWDHWVAFGLLSYIGGKAIYKAFKDKEGETSMGDPTRGLTLVILSVATSIDALAVGLSFAMLDVKIWYPSLIIGIVASAMTLLGMLLGGRIGRLFGKRIEIAGGLVLLGIGVKILLENIIF